MEVGDDISSSKEVTKVGTGTSRRDWISNVMKGIGAVAVGKIRYPCFVSGGNVLTKLILPGSATLEETAEVGLGLRAAPSVIEKAAEVLNDDLYLLQS